MVTDLNLSVIKAKTNRASNPKAMNPCNKVQEGISYGLVYLRLFHSAGKYCIRSTNL